MKCTSYRKRGELTRFMPGSHDCFRFITIGAIKNAV